MESGTSSRRSERLRAVTTTSSSVASAAAPVACARVGAATERPAIVATPAARSEVESLTVMVFPQGDARLREAALIGTM